MLNSKRLLKFGWIFAFKFTTCPNRTQWAKNMKLKCWNVWLHRDKAKFGAYRRNGTTKRATGNGIPTRNNNTLSFRFNFQNAKITMLYTTNKINKLYLIDARFLRVLLLLLSYNWSILKFLVLIWNEWVKSKILLFFFNKLQIINLV